MPEAGAGREVGQRADGRPPHCAQAGAAGKGHEEGQAREGGPAEADGEPEQEPGGARALGAEQGGERQPRRRHVGAFGGPSRQQRRLYQQPRRPRPTGAARRGRNQQSGGCY